MSFLGHALGVVWGIQMLELQFKEREAERRRREAEESLRRAYQTEIDEMIRRYDRDQGIRTIDLAPEDVREVKPAPQLEHQP